VKKRWAKEPRPFLVNNLHLFKKGCVLDIGGSDGVNDLYLAQRGFETTNVDMDRSAIEDFREEAKKLGLKVNGVVANLRDYQIDKNYDNIITFFTLHFLEWTAAEELISEVKSHTRKGGINLIVSFTDKGSFDMNPKQFYPEAVFFEKKYAGWEILANKAKMGPTKEGVEQERVFFLARLR